MTIGNAAPADPASKRAGFVGLGLMGAPMAANLLTAGWNVTGWNRSPGAVRDLEALGGNAASHVADLRDEPVIIFMLPDLPFIEEAAAGLLEAWRAAPPAPGTLVVVMSSVSPVAVRAFGLAVADASGGSASVLDAPVSGGTVGAQRGTLQFRLMMRQRDKIVGEFATGILTARNIGRYSKAEYGDVRSYISRHWLCRSKRDDKISRVIL